MPTMINTQKIATDFQAAIASLLTDEYFTYHSNANFRNRTVSIRKILEEIEPRGESAYTNKIFPHFATHFRKFGFTYLAPGSRRWGFLYKGIPRKKLVIKIDRPLADDPDEGYGNRRELKFHQNLSDPLVSALVAPILATFTLESRYVVVTEYMYTQQEELPASIELESGNPINCDREELITAIFTDSHSGNLAYNSKGLVYYIDTDRELHTKVNLYLNNVIEENPELYHRVKSHLIKTKKLVESST